MKPHIVGTIEIGPYTVYLDRVWGVYADRGSPRKAGYWVKTYDYDTGKITKAFYENLSQHNRLMIAAASTFNQSVEGLLYKESLT